MVRAVDTGIPWFFWGMLGVSNLLFPSGGWVMECTGAWHVLQCMLMVFPDQAGSLQGSRCGSSDILTANDPGTGSGWQQSKQNWALPAVVGYWARMQCSDPCCVQGAQLHPYFSSQTCCNAAFKPRPPRRHARCKIDTCGIRTHAGRPHRLSRPMP